ncbi:MAG: mycofactocin biosynthesis peptidyl-dipeptidase MftE [Austwickia sp.]|nr:mycofactocin biosynthesis peptidyl-dipeptidase MftE [Austwickia sp.]MBK8437876.1 mycofactocin biosynthesis peptidyl-dipeptidase MftE [Austwickia sp.]MBK9100177.1 mycofactocin biosynthesis peptidyl-dipeptidase MftE [Austwickia sp.]
MTLADATWPDIDQSPRPRLLVVPVGSLEQHGPHLPLDCDSVIASAVAAALVSALPGAGLAPVIPIGVSGEHLGFPGTLSVSTHALQTFVVDLSRHAAPHWDAVMLVNGHGGNRGALEAAAAQCRLEGRTLRIWHVDWPGGDAHAGHTETSLMLHLAPRRVRLEHLAAGNIRPLAELMPALRHAGVRAVSPNGVLGDPRQATAADGASTFAALVERALAACQAATPR